MSKTVKIKAPKAAKKKMQDVDFKNVDELLAYLPEEELKIVVMLRKMIFSCLPDCTEKLTYNVPFYKVHANICFIWPPSVKWGGKGQEGVRFGFTKGYLLTDEIGYLDRGTRKQVYWHDFHSMKDIKTEILRAYIFEAALVDEELMKKKRLT